MTAAKIAPRSVDGLRVIDNSLSGADIDESTLDIRPAPSSIGPTELADRQRRLVFTPGMLVSEGGTAKPETEAVGAFPVLSFANNANGFASLATDVPGSRVEGTRMTVRIVWSSNDSGTVDWTYAYQSVATGGDVGAAADLGRRVAIPDHDRPPEHHDASKSPPAPSATATCSG